MTNVIYDTFQAYTRLLDTIFPFFKPMENVGMLIINNVVAYLCTLSITRLGHVFCLYLSAYIILK